MNNNLLHSQKTERLLAALLLMSRIYGSLLNPERSELPVRNALHLLQTKPVTTRIPTWLACTIYASMAFVEESDEWPSKAVCAGYYTRLQVAHGFFFFFFFFLIAASSSPK